MIRKADGFVKGEHKHVFAYAEKAMINMAGFFSYSVHPGNEHDSRTL